MGSLLKVVAGIQKNRGFHIMSFTVLRPAKDMVRLSGPSCFPTCSQAMLADTLSGRGVQPFFCLPGITLDGERKALVQCPHGENKQGGVSYG